MEEGRRDKQTTIAREPKATCNWQPRRVSNALEICLWPLRQLVWFARTRGCSHPPAGVDSVVII